MEGVNAFDLSHLNTNPGGGRVLGQFETHGLDFLRQNLLHAYQYDNVETALRNNALNRELSSLGTALVPANSKVSLNALERVRQLTFPTIKTYTAVLDTARSALREIIDWFRANDRGQRRGYCNHYQQGGGRAGAEGDHS